MYKSNYLHNPQLWQQNATLNTIKMTVKEKIKGILGGLSEGIYEKEEAIQLALLSSVAGESIFLLGPPGVAKSLIARRLKFAFKDGKSFEYLMNKFSTPDEIFGPVSIKKLRDEDKYERLTEKYLPGSNVVFLDEIWKAGPSIQNALLTILNEKIYRNGEQEVKVDIKSIISASNELPPHGENLDALWDRFLLRFIIQEIREKGNFISMLTNTSDVYHDPIAEKYKISNAELEQWEQEISKVELPIEVINTIQMMRFKMEEFEKQSGIPFAVFDRRWKKIGNLLRTSAFLNGRAQADLMDCFLMVHCLWSEPSQIEMLKESVAETIRKHGYSIALNLGGLRKEVADLEEEVDKEINVEHTVNAERLYLIEHLYYEVLQASRLFDGQYVKAAEFERLTLDDYQTIGLYDSEKKLTYKIKAKKSDTENKIEIYHNSKANTFEMKTEKQEQKKFIRRKPHPIVLKYWEEQTTHLLGYTKELRAQFATETPAPLKHLKSNLFVHPSKSELVEANLNDALNEISSLELRIEKVIHAYKNV